MPKPRRVAIMLDLQWPYKRHAGVFVGTQQYAQEKGWESLIDEFVDDTLGSGSRRPAPYDGIIARATRRLALRAARTGVPLVNVWLSSPVWRSLPGVFADHAEMGRLRAEHLLSRGLTRFAALVSEGDRGQQLELEAFTRTVAAAGSTCIARSVSGDVSATAAQWRRTERVIAAWMQGWNPPIGVYVGTESEGRMVAQMCRNRGWRIPDDVAITAGCNEETLCGHLRPTLTSMEVGYERIGYEAARLLEQLMDGEPAPGRPIVLPPTGLVVRESTDFVAVEDPMVAAAMRYIAVKSHLDIGPDDVARAVAAEPRTLQRRFRRHLGRAVAAEIRRVRLERAKRELAQGDDPVAAIARRVGFGGSLRMCEIFRRELGITPSRFRRDHRRVR
jgi:LacI family transcriptional regulator